MPALPTPECEADAKSEHDRRSRPKDRILLYGNLCLDLVLDVPAFPGEDTSTRALAARKALGGNGANSARVLTQLGGGRRTVSWIGPVPRRGDPDTAFALGELQAEGVETSLLEEVGGEGLPTSFILTSRESGSRTIVSTRNGVRELGVAHVESAVRRMVQEEALLGRPSWFHLECRQPPEVTAKMAEAWRSAICERRLPLSVEVEKPGMPLDGVAALLPLCDFAFFSSEWIRARQVELLASEGEPLAGEDGAEPPEKRPRLGEAELQQEDQDHLAVRCLRGLQGRVQGPTGLWICAWGALGAFALDAKTGASYFQEAAKQTHVVDSVGAGDTFNAAVIHALASGADPQGALRCGCAVAGRKVSQVGFGALAGAVPAGC